MFFVEVRRNSSPGWRSLFRTGTLGAALSTYYVLRGHYPTRRFRIMYCYKDDFFHVPVNVTGAARRTRKEARV